MHHGNLLAEEKNVLINNFHWTCIKQTRRNAVLDSHQSQLTAGGESYIVRIMFLSQLYTLTFLATKYKGKFTQ